MDARGSRAERAAVGSKFAPRDATHGSRTGARPASRHLLLPARQGGHPGNFAAAFRAEGGGAGAAAFEAAQPAEGGGVRVARRHRSGHDGDTFGRRLAAAAGRAEDIGFLGLDSRFLPIADQAAAADLQDHVFSMACLSGQE